MVQLLCMFIRIIDAIHFIEIMDASVIPFFAECFPGGNCFFKYRIIQNTEVHILRGTLKHTT